MDANFIQGLHPVSDFVTASGRNLILNDGTEDGYSIPFREILNNPTGLLRWIHHLNEKRWFNRYHIYGLIMASKVNIYG